MRIIFLGTPDFAAHSLQVLHSAGKNIVAVITAPDRKAGRGQQVQESAVKKYAKEAGIDCLQPTNLKDPEFLKRLKAYKADIQIVVAFRMLPEMVWDMPPLGTMNLHASLLPSYRGAAPINWAIINGEEKSGVSTFFLKHEIDTGEILLREEVKLAEDETAGSLHDKLMQVGANLLLSSINLIEKGEYETISQTSLLQEGKSFDELPVAPKIFRDDCKINWDQSARDIDRLIRGLSPYPAAWTQMKRKKDGKKFNLKIFKTKVLDHKKENDPSYIFEADRSLFVHCKIGSIELIEVQLEGKKRMKAKDLLNGVNLDDYENCLS